MDPLTAGLAVAIVSALISLARWKSGDRENVLAQTSHDLATAAAEQVRLVREDNARLRAENAQLVEEIRAFERRVESLTVELDKLRGELAQTRIRHTGRNG